MRFICFTAYLFVFARCYEIANTGPVMVFSSKGSAQVADVKEVEFNEKQSVLCLIEDLEPLHFHALNAQLSKDNQDFKFSPVYTSRNTINDHNYGEMTEVKKIKLEDIDRISDIIEETMATQNIKAEDEFIVTFMAASKGLSSRRLEQVNSETLIRIDPNILAALLYSLLFFMITGIYLCCLDCVEAPAYFATRQPYMGKEFL